MAQNELSQNELFRLLGNYPAMPEIKNEPVISSLSSAFQLKILKRNIRRCGIVKSAVDWKSYSDPYIRCALKLAASGMPRDLVHSLIGSAVFAERKDRRREQHAFNEEILAALYYKSDQSVEEV